MVPEQLLCLRIIIPFLYFFSLLKVRTYLRSKIKNLKKKNQKFKTLLELDHLYGFFTKNVLSSDLT